MKKKTLIIALLALLFIPLFALSGADVSAVSAYKTYTTNRYGYLVETNEAYEAVDMIRYFGDNLSFSGAKDLFIDTDDYLYVADTGNKRIVVFDENQNYLYHFGSDLLKRPTGIYVRNNSIYVADYGTALSNTDLGAIYRYTIDKTKVDVVEAITLENTYSTPDSPILQVDNFIFRPLKIAVDHNETMYVVAEGVTNGVLMIDKTNRFINYFASNGVDITLWERFERFFYGNNPDVTLTKNIPPSVFNVTLDEAGYFYTVTQSASQQGDNLKKVNLGGINFYPEDLFIFADPVDAWPGSVGNTYIITAGGNIMEYDSLGNLLFKFGGLGTGNDKLGLFLSASAIAVDSKNQVYVIDDHQSRNSIQMFRETEFAVVIHEALDLFNQAKYAESIAVWEDVLRYNSMLDMAYRGIGLGHLMNEDYQDAMEYFQIADDRAGYSEAFWSVRNDWLSVHFETVLLVAFLLIAFFIALRQIDRKKAILEPVRGLLIKVKQAPVVNELVYMFRFLKHPSDAVYEIKAKHRVSVSSAWLLLGMLFALYLVHLVATGFIFNPIVIENTILLNEALKIIIPILIFVVANYLMSSLMEGEGTFKATFVSTVGALIPVFVLLPIAIVLSNILTLNEGFLYQFTLFLMIAWSAILVFFNIKETHNYSVSQTIVNLLLTFLMMVVLIVILLMVYLMVLQVYHFIADILKEVILRE
jgi:tetratricopeptide (TPR) repeat protein